MINICQDHRLVAAGTVDEYVLAALENKTVVQDLLMQALKTSEQSLSARPERSTFGRPGF